jgi:outer membrane protein OmpA-like peptidoglycan-associated protein
MRVNHNSPLAASALLLLGLPASAFAQDGNADLMQQSVSQLKSEIGRRYNDALALTQDRAVVGADNSRFDWAAQAKAQCGIAIGFLKSGTKDPVSIGKCDEAWRRMQVQAPVATQVVVPPPPPVVCNKGPFIVFFDWDSSDISPDAAKILDSMVASYAGCGSAAVTVAGYADRSGSDSYNQGLSVRRANSVRQYLGPRSVPDSAMTVQGFGETNPRVPTADGVRELQNRRVEINVN